MITTGTRIIVQMTVGGSLAMGPILSALLMPVDQGENVTFKLRHPWRWCVRHSFIAARRALRDRRR
jgi:hypothetical protein